jgi:hypothetical protein
MVLLEVLVQELLHQVNHIHTGQELLVKVIMVATITRPHLILAGAVAVLVLLVVMVMAQLVVLVALDWHLLLQVHLFIMLVEVAVVGLFKVHHQVLVEMVVAVLVLVRQEMQQQVLQIQEEEAVVLAIQVAQVVMAVLVLL